MLSQQQADKLRPLLANMEQGAKEQLELVTLLRGILNEREPPPISPPAPGGSAHAPPQANTDRKIAWGAKVSPEFKRRVILTGEDFDINPDWLMACMAFETGRTFSPSVKNPNSSATGLIQFMRQTALDLGTTVEALAGMTAERQFDYVWLYFRDRIREHGPIRSLADCYMAILWPAAIGKPDTHKLWIAGSSAFRVNAGLDTNKDGVVTKAEAAAKVEEQLRLGLQPGNIG